MTKYDIREYLNTQAQETCRAFVIYSPAKSGKTALARRMEEYLNVFRIDLQSYFLEQIELTNNIDLFRPKDLESLLKDLDIPQHVVVVDNLDFLLNTWTPKMKHDFVAMVDLRLKSPDVTSKTFVFLLQNDPVIIEHKLLNSRKQPRILPLNALKSLTVL